MAADNALSLDIVVKIIGFGGAIATFIVGIVQYNRGQRWQKTSILLSLIDDFEGDEGIRAAREMLDWDKRKVFIKDKCIDFENAVLVKALEVVPWDDGRFTEQESLIRDCFDSFFDFFHKLYSFQKSNLLSFNDFAYFYYYLELLRDIENYKGEGYKKVFDEYIKGYQFIGIKTLLEEYKKNPLPLDIMER